MDRTFRRSPGAASHRRWPRACSGTPRRRRGPPAEFLDLLDLARRRAREAGEALLRVVLERELAGEVVFLVAGRRVVRVGVADEAVLEGIAGAGRGLAHAVEERLAHEAALVMLRPLEVRRQRVVPLLEAGELVFGREVGVTFRRALDLGDLVERLVGVAGLVVGRVDRLAVALHRVEHEAVARVGVVRNGEQRRAPGPLVVHPLPQDLRIVRIERRQHHVRQVLRVAEDDDAMEVSLLRVRRPFEAGERRELSGDVVRLRRLDDLGPDRPRERRIAQLRIAFALAHVAQDSRERLQPHVGVRRVHAPGDLRLADRAVGIRHLVEDAHVLGMVGHPCRSPGGP